MDLHVLRLLGSCRVSRLLSGSFDAHMTRLEVAHVLIVVGRIGGGLVVVSRVVRGAQGRAKRPSGAGAVLAGRYGRISALRRLQPHH